MSPAVKAIQKILHKEEKRIQKKINKDAKNDWLDNLNLDGLV